MAKMLTSVLMAKTVIIAILVLMARVITINILVLIVNMVTIVINVIYNGHCGYNNYVGFDG